MNRRINLKILLAWIGIAFIGGLANYFFFKGLVNPYNEAVVGDQTQVSYFFSGALTLWALLAVWMALRADEEFKKAQEAKERKNFKAFRIEADKRLPVPLWIIYALSAFLTIRAFHLYHFTAAATMEIQFWWPVLVIVVSMLIKDLDGNPTTGVITMDAPKKWVERLNGKNNDRMEESHDKFNK